jgi:hypothetical protein
VQVLDPAIEVSLLVLPSQPINSGRRVSLESKECGPKHRNDQKVEKRELDRSNLTALPAEPYCFAEWASGRRRLPCRA